MGFLFQSSDEGGRPKQRLVEVVNTKEQEQSIAGLSVPRTGRGWMLVGSLLVEAKQDSSIRVYYLPEVLMSGTRFPLAKQRLIPIEAARNINNTDDCPRALHRFLLRANEGVQWRLDSPIQSRACQVSVATPGQAASPQLPPGDLNLVPDRDPPRSNMASQNGPLASNMEHTLYRDLKHECCA